MPFIWDDRDWKLIGDDEDYDKHRFVVVRKLFVQQKAPFENGQHFNKAFLLNEFQKYGEIESVELMHRREPMAYITFKRDLNACWAMTANRLNIFIQPADTWHQPLESGEEKVVDTEGDLTEEVDAVEPPIFKLNEDCFIKLFEYCDAETLVDLSESCKFFHDLVKRHGYPRKRTLKLNIPFESASMPLAKTRKILRRVGQSIERLYIYWPASDSKEKGFSNIDRFAQKVNQYVGTNLQALHLVDSDDNEQLFNPILKNLHTLKLKSCDQGYPCAFYQNECPQLTKFSYYNCSSSLILRKPWSTLQKFKFYFREEQDLHKVANLMVNLEKLTIYGSLRLKATSLNLINVLDHLTKLHLHYVGLDEVNGILECLAQFTRLRELKLSNIIHDNKEQVNQRLIIDLAKSLSNLEHMFFDEFKLEGSTVLQFVQNAPRLKKLHVHGDLVEDIMTQTLIMDLVNLLQHRSTLKFFLDSHLKYRLKAATTKEIQKYLIVYFNCQHCRT